MAASEEREEQLEQDLGELHALLAAEKEAAAGRVSTAVAEAAAEGRKASAAAVIEAEARGRQDVQALESRIAAKEAELEVRDPLPPPPPLPIHPPTPPTLSAVGALALFWQGRLFFACLDGEDASAGLGPLSD